MLLETIIAAIPGSIAAFAALDGRRLGKVNHQKITGIDEAVNGSAPGEDSIRENVQTLVDQAHDG
jgi:hypothetical protein